MLIRKILVEPFGQIGGVRIRIQAVLRHFMTMRNVEDLPAGTSLRNDESSSRSYLSFIQELAQLFVMLERVLLTRQKTDFDRHDVVLARNQWKCMYE